MKYRNEKGILRKYFHGLTDEQFDEEIKKWPLSNVLEAMSEALLGCKWIDASKEEPFINEAVWVYSEKQIIFGQYGYDSTGSPNYFDRYGNPLDNVTHWMTIKRPNSPKEQKTF